jgi:hypothetical protein
MKACGGVGVWTHIFLSSALAAGERSASRPGRFTPDERAPGIYWIVGWVDPRASLDDMEKTLDLTGTNSNPLALDSWFLEEYLRWITIVVTLIYKSLPILFNTADTSLKFICWNYGRKSHNDRLVVECVRESNSFWIFAERRFPFQLVKC